MRLLVILCSLMMLLEACNHSQIAFNKRYLQDPTMDPTKTSNLSNAHLLQTYQAHDLGAAAGAASASGTCPTCGG